MRPREQRRGGEDGAGPRGHLGGEARLPYEGGMVALNTTPFFSRSRELLVARPPLLEGGASAILRKGGCHIRQPLEWRGGCHIRQPLEWRGGCHMQVLRSTRPAVVGWRHVETRACRRSRWTRWMRSQ
eukprot:1994309-Prymnesium_polylepis.1